MRHVVPKGEEGMHDEESTMCFCSPDVDWGDSVVTHFRIDSQTKALLEQAHELVAGVREPEPYKGPMKGPYGDLPPRHSLRKKR